MRRSAALLLGGLLHFVAAQPVPLPNMYDGFRVGSPSAPVMLEGYLDLLCPDCAQAWPTLQAVMAYYGGDKLQFTMHIFPLPYHTWAFTASHGASIIKAYNGSDSAVFAWASALFDGAQDTFTNAATAAMTLSQVQAAYAALAQKTVGIPTATFLAGFGNANLNMDARISFKFSCSRYSTGTPNFHVNGLPVSADSTWSLAEWQQLLDPLFSASTQRRMIGRS